MMKRGLVIVFFLSFACSVIGWGQTRRALVVGIGEYQDARWGQRIHGDTDVDYAVDLLTSNGFSDIRTLRNKEATKEAIISSLKELLQSCRNGDRIYIHFSGHGQQITDLDGDEEDGYDEAWIPYDAEPFYSDSYKGEKHLTDDELSIFLAAIRRMVGSEGRILVVVDACHSGSSTRDADETMVARGFDRKFEIPGCKAERKPQPTEEWITISACKSYQVNWEVPNPAVGKLTWSLYRLRDQLASLTNQDLKVSITQIMQENPGPLGQTPEITGRLQTESVKDIFE